MIYAHRQNYIAPALMEQHTWYLYRDSGIEVKLWLYEDQILSNLTLSKQEKQYVLNNILRPSKINSNEQL